MEQSNNEDVTMEILNNSNNDNNDINENVDNFGDFDLENEIIELTQIVNSDSESIINTDLELNIEEENQGLLANEEINIPLQNLNMKDSSNNNKRQYWIDALRIVSSYMVVLVHCSSYAIFEVPIFTSPWYGLMFWDAMSRACVPLFVMISGILFLDPKKEISLKKLYKKYIFRIFKNIVFWNIFYATIVKYLINPFNLSYSWGFHNITEFITDVLYGKFHIWYLYMCIGLYAMTPLIKAFTSNEVTMKYFIALGLTIVQIVPYVSNIFRDFIPNLYFKEVGEVMGKLMIYIAYGYTIYYALGYYLNQLEIKRKSVFVIIYSLGLINLGLTYFFKVFLSLKYQQEYNIYGDYNSFNVCICAISIFIFFKYVVGKILNKLFQIKGFKTLLLTLSDLSFGIYLIHIFYFDIFRVLKFNSYSFNPFICSPIHALCIWISGAITVYLMKKLPILKILFKF